MNRFVFFAIVAAICASVEAGSKCSDVKTDDSFDFSAYGKGTWYEIARYPNNAEKGADCGWGEYTPAGDVVKVKNYHLLNNKIKVIEGTHQAQSSGKVTVKLPYGDGDVTLNVLSYTGDYLVGYYCKDTKDGHEDFSWILSRSKNISAETRAEIDKILKDSKVVDASKYVWPSFSNEACKLNI